MKMKRKMYDKLLEWKENPQKMPLIVLGVRQCGKTYIIREFCKNEYKNFIEINLLERQDIIDIYKSTKSSDDKFKELKIRIGKEIEDKDTILFVDELQACEELIQELKYFCEAHSDMNLITAGSLLGVKLSKSKVSKPVGKASVLDMYPMDFEEFLWATGNEMLAEEIKERFKSNKPFSKTIHEMALDLYKLYFFIGGMPKVIGNFINNDMDYIKHDKSLIKDIERFYHEDFTKHVDSINDTLKLEETYNSLAPQLSNESHKFQYSNIRSGAKSDRYITTIEWLKSAHLVNQIHKVTLPEKPLEGYKDKKTFKLFLSDVGLLNSILHVNITDVLDNSLSLYKGVIAENYVANQLVANGISVYYYLSEGKMEIDFLISNNDGIIPIEVKSSENTKSKSLSTYIKKYSPMYSIRVSSKNFGFDSRNNIKSVPLYAVYAIEGDMYDEETLNILSTHFKKLKNIDLIFNEDD